MSGRSIEKESCKSTELKRWIVTEILWKRNRTSQSSPEIWEILRPSSLRKSNVEELNGPRFSTDTGWKTYCALRSAYLAVFLSAAWSATSPAPVAAVSTYDPANVLATVTSHYASWCKQLALTISLMAKTCPTCVLQERWSSLENDAAHISRISLSVALLTINKVILFNVYLMVH